MAKNKQATDNIATFGKGADTSGLSFPICKVRWCSELIVAATGPLGGTQGPFLSFPSLFPSPRCQSRQVPYPSLGNQEIITI